MLGKKYCKIFINIIILTFLNFRALELYYFWYLPLSESHTYNVNMKVWWGVFEGSQERWKTGACENCELLILGLQYSFSRFVWFWSSSHSVFRHRLPLFPFPCEVLQFEGSLGKFVWRWEFTYLCQKNNVYGK